MRFVVKPRGWFSEYHEQVMHPSITVIETEKDLPRLVLPDGTELVGVREIGFRAE